MQDIKVFLELMDAVAARGFAEFELETDDFKIKLKRAGADVAAIPAAPAVASASASAAVATAAAAVQVPAAPAIPEGRTVEAPLVGIFIEVGQAVKKGDTLFIIEAMKTMNEIPAPCDGIISHVLAQSGDMVEYGQVVVVMEEKQ